MADTVFILGEKYDIVVPEERENVGNVIRTVLIQKTKQNSGSVRNHLLASYSY
jgi:hypothetical protein